MKTSKMTPEARAARRRAILEKRLDTLRTHLYRMGPSYLTRPVLHYPHSSKRQQARYARQSNV